MERDADACVARSSSCVSSVASVPRWLVRFVPTTVAFRLLMQASIAAVGQGSPQRSRGIHSPAESRQSPLKGTPIAVFAVGFSPLGSIEPGNSFPGDRDCTLATSSTTHSSAGPCPETQGSTFVIPAEARLHPSAHLEACFRGHDSCCPHLLRRTPLRSPSSVASGFAQLRPASATRGNCSSAASISCCGSSRSSSVPAKYWS